MKKTMRTFSLIRTLICRPTGVAVWFLLAIVGMYGVLAVPTASHAQQAFTLVHRASGMCVMPLAGDSREGSRLVLSGRGCSGRWQAKFVFNSNNQFVHLQSGKCIAVERDLIAPDRNKPTFGNYGDDTRLVMRKCQRAVPFEFRLLDHNAIMHQWSGKCIHPYRGKLIPDSNTVLVMYGGCYEGLRIIFDRRPV